MLHSDTEKQYANPNGSLNKQWAFVIQSVYPGIPQWWPNIIYLQ